MKKRFTEEQIIGALKEHESGLKVDDICRRLGISNGTFYNWRSKYGGLEVSEAKRLQRFFRYFRPDYNAIAKFIFKGC